ncbi:MAG: hypothetical protein H6Q70_72 [Firmicutes bacterium]|nr:hypothetical protein [Bacillota bacterium]
MNFLEAIDNFEKIKQETLVVDHDSVSSWTYDDVKIKVDFCNYVVKALSRQGSEKGFHVELPKDFMVPTSADIADSNVCQTVENNLTRLDHLPEDITSQITVEEQNNYKAVLKENTYEWMLPAVHRPQDLKVVATALMQGKKNEALECLSYYMLKNTIDHIKLIGLKEQSDPACIYATILDAIHDCEYSSEAGFPEKMLTMEVRETMAMAKALGVEVRVNADIQQNIPMDPEKITSCRESCKVAQMQVCCQKLADYVEEIIEDKDVFKKFPQKKQADILQAKYYLEKINPVLNDSQAKFSFKDGVIRDFKELVTTYHTAGVNKDFLEKLNRFELGEAHYKLGLKQKDSLIRDKGKPTFKDMGR